MPLILAIECSSPKASLALVRDGEVLVKEGFESDRRHNALLFEPLQLALGELGEESPDLVLIGTGPGSYSGTRVGIAAGQGVAMIHACPAVGLSSLLALGEQEGVVIGDARRGKAWWAELGSGLPSPQLVGADELTGILEGRRDVFACEDVTALGLPQAIEVLRLTPDAVCLAAAWGRLSEEDQSAVLAEPPQPAYLAPPHITKAKPGHPLLRGSGGSPG